MSVGEGHVKCAGVAEVSELAGVDPVRDGEDDALVVAGQAVSGDVHAVQEVDVDGGVLDAADSPPGDFAGGVFAVIGGSPSAQREWLAVSHSWAGLVADVAQDAVAGGAGGAECDLVPAGLVGAALSFADVGSGILVCPFLGGHGASGDNRVDGVPEIHVV